MRHHPLRRIRRHPGGQGGLQPQAEDAGEHSSAGIKAKKEPFPTQIYKLNKKSNRLPTNVIPSRYDLDLIVELDPVWEIDGFFSVEAVVTPTGDAERDNRVTLNSDGITIDEETIMVLVPTTKLWNRTIVHPFHMRDRIIFIYRTQIDHYLGSIWNKNRGI